MIKINDSAIRNYSYVVLILNLSIILFGLLYLIIPGQTGFWDFCGWVFFLSWVITIPLPVVSSNNIHIGTSAGQKINRSGNLVLIILAIIPIIMFGATSLLSMAITNTFSAIGGYLLQLYGCFFLCSLINVVYTTRLLQYFKTSSSAESIPTVQSNKIMVLKVLFLLCAFFGLFGMIYFALLSLFGARLGVDSVPYIGGYNGVIGVMSATYGWLFSVLTWVLTVGGIKMLKSLKKPKITIAYGLIGVFTVLILLTPMVVTPLLTTATNAEFETTFNWDWDNQIPTADLIYFKNRPLVAADYYLSQPVGDCQVFEHISFYNGTLANEIGLELYFDAYLPPANTPSLPGKNSTLIRIHGGGWTIGDKGAGNNPLMNQYFAAQGYCVFDIQYGLNNKSTFLSFGNAITPKYLLGNYSINDMVRHIGIFCQFLTNHQAEYYTNLNSTFISGGSAGGHLTCVTALAIASGNYTSLFGSSINVKGYIPFYPANGVSEFIDGGISNPEFYDPGLLVTKESPPCLIYQGEQDGLVDPQKTRAFKEQYTTQGNSQCMIISIPFAGHGSDIDFYGYFNQFFLYYMERFMYLYH